MRIGEIAALVGITTRAIRHYHHVGLLPKPERRPNGYRAYSIRDAVQLARVRRLTESGQDREYVMLMDATSTGNQEIFALLGTLVADPAVIELYGRLDALAEAPADDPRIAALTADRVAVVPDELFAAIPEDGVVVTGLKEALLAEYAPAQAEVVSRLMDAFVERGRR